MNEHGYKCGMKDIFERFIEYKKSTGRKERLYVSVLKTFDNYCCSLPSFATTLDKEIVDGFLQITDQRRISSALKDASVLRELGRYMHRIGIKDAYVTGLHGSKKSTYISNYYQSLVNSDMAEGKI